MTNPTEQPRPFLHQLKSALMRDTPAFGGTEPRTGNPGAADSTAGSVLDNDAAGRCNDCGQPMDGHCPDCCDEARQSRDGTE